LRQGRLRGCSPTTDYAAARTQAQPRELDELIEEFAVDDPDLANYLAAVVGDLVLPDKDAAETTKS
jgi:hypothetical protein